jgi:ketosteroid isomerase-like protein
VSEASDAVEVVRKFGALMTRDLSDDGSPHEERLAEIMELVHPDIVVPVAGSLPFGGIHVGHDSFLAMGAEFAKTWVIIESEAEIVGMDDGRVAVFDSPLFESVATGRQVRCTMVEFLRVKDGKIAEVVPYYFDTMELVETLSDDKAGAHRKVVWPA